MMTYRQHTLTVQCQQQRCSPAAIGAPTSRRRSAPRCAPRPTPLLLQLPTAASNTRLTASVPLHAAAALPPSSTSPCECRPGQGCRTRGGAARARTKAQRMHACTPRCVPTADAAAALTFPPRSTTTTQTSEPQSRATSGGSGTSSRSARRRRGAAPRARRARGGAARRQRRRRGVRAPQPAPARALAAAGGLCIRARGARRRGRREGGAAHQGVGARGARLGDGAVSRE